MREMGYIATRSHVRLDIQKACGKAPPAGCVNDQVGLMTIPYTSRCECFLAQVQLVPFGDEVGAVRDNEGACLCGASLKDPIKSRSRNIVGIVWKFARK